MTKSIKPLAFITAGISFFYALLYFIVDFIVLGALFTGGSATDSDSFVLVVGLVSFLLFFVMLTLGIILTVFTAKLPKGTPGKTLLLVASIMTIAGFVVGLINVVRGIYLVVSGILLIVGAIQYSKANNNMQQQVPPTDYIQ